MTRLSPLWNRRILVTGGTGFIGGRVVERLAHDHQAVVRVLVRDLSKAFRAARFPVELVPGDVTDPAAVAQAMKGCEIVFHCAYGSSGSTAERRRVNVEGTRNILEAAQRERVARVVHVSTVMVYGPSRDGELDESASRRPCGLSYADAKLEAETLALQFGGRHGLPVTVLQPTAVYGPFGEAWTGHVLQQLKTGRVILVNGGEGWRNVVYVDDLVSAMFLAATHDQAIGESFLISSEEPVTWRTFYERFERMVGPNRTVTMSEKEAKRFCARQQRPNGLIETALELLRLPAVRESLGQSAEAHAARRLIRAVMPRSVRAALKASFNEPAQETATLPTPKPVLPTRIHAMDPHLVPFMAGRTRVRITKAKELLGYQPAFSFERGMALTEE